MMQAVTMARTKARRKREAVVMRDRIGPTPQTAAKMTDDPLVRLLEAHGGRDGELWRAADEILEIYLAVCREVMSRIGGLKRSAAGRYEMPESLARAHANRYLPWSKGQPRGVMEAVIEIVVERRPLPKAVHPFIIAALRSYARLMIAN